MTDSAPAEPPTTKPSEPSANRVVGILHGGLPIHPHYDEHLACHNEPDKLSPAA
jgi:hypothetical protein